MLPWLTSTQFLVQSDFITQASREDTQQSKWNEVLLDGVASTFQRAVLEFCHVPALQYSWLKYLPSENISDPFWGQLRGKILDKLKTAQVFLSWKGDLCVPTNLKQLPVIWLDQHFQQLFDGLESEIYLSGEYEAWVDSDCLASLRVEEIGWDDILDRVEPYLEGSNP